MKKILIRIFLNTLIGVILIALWLQTVNINEIFQKISELSPLVFLSVIAFTILAGAVRGARLWLLLPTKSTSLKNSILITLISQLLSFTIPIRLGEISKGVYLSTQTKLPFAKSVIWIFLDRFIDFWVVVSLIAVLIAFSPLNIPDNIKMISVLLAVISATVLAITIYFPEFIKKIGGAIINLFVLTKIKNLLHKLMNLILNSLEVLPKDPKKQLIIILVTLFSWTIESIPWYILFTQLGINGLSPLTILLGSSLMALSFLIPAAPGYVGSIQAAAVVIFSIFLGLNKEVVSAAAVVMNIGIICAVLISGITSLYLLKFDLTLIKEKLKLK